MPSTIFSKPLNKQVAQNTADIAALSTSMGNANGAIAIVATGDTAPKAIPAGQFVLWSGGLYTANSAIASGETLSLSNLTAVPDGGLNAVKSAIPAVVDNLTSDSTTSALSAAQGKALNGKITQINLGTLGTLSAIESALAAQLSILPNASSQDYFFTVTSADIPVFNVWTSYVGKIYKTTDDRGVAEFFPHGGEAKNIIGFYVNSAWTWSSLYDKLRMTGIMTQLSIPTTVTSYSCNWSQYRILVIQAMFYGNVMASIVVPTSYFSATSNGQRVMITDTIGEITYDVYKDGNNKVNIKASVSSSTRGITIYGFI